MKKILNEFKEFISKGNVLDLAVGVIIGGAFSKIVTSLVNDILMPLLGIVIGGLDFTNLTLKFNFRYNPIQHDNLSRSIPRPNFLALNPLRRKL